MKRYFFLAIFLVTCTISVVYADTSAVTGFIPGQIWYSKETLVEGDTVKIYTAIWNGDTNAVNARVEFYDKNVILGTRDIIVDPSHLQDVSVSWKVTAGDHIISAKISSSSTVNNGKKEQITLDNVTTSEDRTFVPVSIKVADNTQAKATDVVKNEVTKAATAAKDIIPSSVSNSFSSFDSLRDSTYTQIVDNKNKTQKQIDSLSVVTQPATATQIKDKNTKTQPKSEQTQSKPLDTTEKPIAYVKLFLLSILGFIFGSKLFFYGLILLLLFLIFRFIYRKIKNR